MSTPSTESTKPKICGRLAPKCSPISLTKVSTPGPTMTWYSTSVSAGTRGKYFVKEVSVGGIGISARTVPPWAVATRLKKSRWSWPKA